MNLAWGVLSAGENRLGTAGGSLDEEQAELFVRWGRFFGASSDVLHGALLARRKRWYCPLPRCSMDKEVLATSVV